MAMLPQRFITQQNCSVARCVNLWHIWPPRFCFVILFCMLKHWHANTRTVYIIATITRSTRSLVIARFARRWRSFPLSVDSARKSRPENRIGQAANTLLTTFLMKLPPVVIWTVSRSATVGAPLCARNPRRQKLYILSKRELCGTFQSARGGAIPRPVF